MSVEQLEQRATWLGIAILLAVMAGCMVYLHATATPSSGSSIVPYSALLDADLPGAIPAPRPDMALVSTAQRIARALEAQCGQPREAYQATDSPALLASIKAQAEAQGWPVGHPRSPAGFQAALIYGPQRVLVLATGADVMACPLVGLDGV